MVLLALLALQGCASLRYYAHVTRGEAQILVHRRPTARVIADPSTDPALARRLATAVQARRYASRELALPDNASYTTYVALGRPYVVWNVFATRPYSVDALPQCFPIAGCVAYRGYFRHELAEAAARRLRGRGDDVWIGDVPAYSTLGWFADPILSSMLRWDDDELVGTIFHELAHQRAYAKGDTAFNESYATFVQQQGLRQWRKARGLAPVDDARAQAMDDGFTELVLGLRDRLRRRYADASDDAARARAKRQEIADFRRRYARWRDTQWPGQHDYDAWVATPINNARLVPFGVYDRWVPAFAALFRAGGDDWKTFHRRVAALTRQKAAARDRALQALLPRPARSSALPAGSSQGSP